MDSCLLVLTTSTSHMQGCFKIDVDLIKLSNVSFLCMKSRVFCNDHEMAISGQGYQHLTRFSWFHCSNLQLVLCKRLTLLAAWGFAIEGLFIYIYFLLFEKKSSKLDFQSWRKNFSNDFAVFGKMIA